MKNFDEKELVSKLDRILKKEFGTNLLFHEFSAGYGIADLVFAPNFSFSKRLVKRKPLTNFNSLKILLTLEEQKKYELSDVLQIFSHLLPTEVKQQLKTLTDNEYLKKTGKNTYCKTLSKESFNPINYLQNNFVIARTIPV